MRGSVYYQTAILTKLIFFEGAKKSDRVNPNHEHYGCVSSFKRWRAIEMFGITFLTISKSILNSKTVSLSQMNISKAILSIR